MRDPVSDVRLRRPRRAIGDRGQAGGAEVIPLAFLTFVFALLVIVNAWSVVDADLATTSAAREAVRAFVEAPDEPSAFEAANAAASQAISGHGRSTDATAIAVQYLDDRGWGRCSRVAVTVHHPMPAIRVPVLGGYGHGFDVIATGTEVIDPYRGGLEGDARC